MRKALLLLALPLLTLAAAASNALAQSDTYPAKPITLIVGYPPGGSTDLTARTLAPELAKRLGQSVVVENIGGAGGTIGAQRVVNAAPDGYTLLLGANNEVVIARQINAAVKYDSLRDLTPIGFVASQPMLIVASAKSGVKTIDDFITAARRSPGKFSYGSSGIGTALHLAGELIQERASLSMVHVPYRGVAPLTTDLISSNVDFGVFVLSSGLPHVQSGKVIAIGTTEPQRSPLAPNIPALGEHPALKGFDLSSWFGLFGPAKMPAPVLERLRRELSESLKSPELRTKFAQSGAMVGTVGGDFSRYVGSEIEKVQRIVKNANIKAE